MAFKKIADEVWRKYIHVAYQESAESVYKYAKRQGLTNYAFKDFEEHCKHSGGFVLWCDESNILLTFPKEDEIKYAAASTVSHECFHVVSHVLRKAGVILTEESEEVYAYYLGWLMDKVCRFLYKTEQAAKKKAKKSKSK